MGEGKVGLNKVIVVGAGVSGLTAAYKLKQAGFEVQVLEASDKAGGRVQSLHSNGFIMDLGADVNTSGYLTYLELTRDLGLESEMSPITRQVGTIVQGKVRYMDTASLWSMATTSTYSLATKLRLLRGMKKIAGDLQDIDFRFLYKAAERDDPHRSAENFGLRHFGPVGNDYMIDPLARVVHATGAEHTSILDIATGLALADAKTWTFLGGADRLVKALSAEVPIAFNATVQSVEETDGKVTITYRDRQGSSVTEEAGASVLAVMYEDMLGIYPQLEALSPELHADIRYMDVFKIHLGYKVATNTRAFTIQVPSVEDPEAFLIFLDHNKAPDRAPSGCSLINLQTDVRFAKTAAAMSENELVSWAQSKAEKYFPELQGQFSGLSNVAHWPRLGNLNYPGYYRNVARFVERLDKQSRIQLAGDMFSKTSQENAATSGKLAAEAVQRILS